MSRRTGALCWVHFGDLHITAEGEENYADFLALLGEVNANLTHGVDFALLPGDNAEDGIEQQYELVRRALATLKLPVQVIAGDHDRKAGTLDAFRGCLEPSPSRVVVWKNFQLFFLNAMDGVEPETFDLGLRQLAWLREEIKRGSEFRHIFFVHLYPSELATAGDSLTSIMREAGVEVVEMGHRHYNELANDGQTIFVATRSTGQVEEGPPGFSLTCIDDDVVSWKFNERGRWPLVVITQPCDYRLITDAASTNQVVRGTMPVRAKAWDAKGIERAHCIVDGSDAWPMHSVEGNCWEVALDSRALGDGVHSVRVEVESSGGSAQDEIRVLVDQAGHYLAPERALVDRENRIGAWPEKGILGTQLGPNEKGTKGPWPSWRGR